MKNSVIFVGVVIVVVTGLLFLGKSFTSHPNQVANASGDEDRFNGKPAPNFDLKVLDGKGKTLKLSDLKGKAVVVNFWATWCDPCKHEMPWLVDLQKKYGAQGLQIVGISMEDTDQKTISEFAHKMGVNYPILIGTDKVAELYGGIDGMPTTFFVDRSGRIVDHELGLQGMDILETNIKKSMNSTETAKAQ